MTPIPQGAEPMNAQTDPVVHEVIINDVPLRYVNKTLSTEPERIYETDTLLYLLGYQCDPPADVDITLRSEEHFPGMVVAQFSGMATGFQFEDPKAIPQGFTFFGKAAQETSVKLIFRIPQ